MRQKQVYLNLVRAVDGYEREGLPLDRALRTIMLDRPPGWLIRGEAARLLAIAEGASVAASLIQQFFAQSEKIELWETALTLEWFGDTRAVEPLARALRDDNHNRRHAAARALGWIADAGRPAVDALMGALSDRSQPVAVRVEAAESLAYRHSTRAIPPLIAALKEPDAGIRFWSVFALGSIRDRETGHNKDRRVIPALEAMLSDNAVPPGDWWSVAREALAMLGNLVPPEPPFRAQLAAEIKRVLSDPGASPEDRRWAEGYGDSLCARSSARLS